jgi:hypothetical protein
MGPLVYVRTADDPRLYPPIPRESQEGKTLMAWRTGCERSNALRKSATHFLVRLYLVSLLEHAQVWLAADRKQFGHGPLRLIGGVPAAAWRLTARQRVWHTQLCVSRAEVCPETSLIDPLEPLGLRWR